jgi:hypothetical protein
MDLQSSPVSHGNLCEGRFSPISAGNLRTSAAIAEDSSFHKGKRAGPETQNQLLCVREDTKKQPYFRPLLGYVISIVYTRVSRERPRLKAFCRVAPSVRFNFLAILPAAVFFRASDLSVCSSRAVQLRLLEPFFTISFSFR